MNFKGLADEFHILADEFKGLADEGKISSAKGIGYIIKPSARQPPQRPPKP